MKLSLVEVITPWLLANVLFLAACSAPPQAQEMGHLGLGTNGANFEPVTGSEYGADGSMSDSDFSILMGLAWPQVYNDMIGTFGYPTHRTEGADYYASDSNPEVWIVVYYSGLNATGYEVKSKGE